MMKRALVLGSQIEGLRGVENDTLAMKAMLEARDFKVDLRTDDQATRDGILAGYEALIEQSGPEDTAVVYYSGHGFYGTVAGESATWQCIAPTDLRDGSQNDFRGITAWELSILQGRLTRKTRNVTVILDCCHSSQMSRDAAVRDAVPRALPNPVELGFAAHLDALRAKYGAAFAAVDPVGNPDAVRLVACAQSESAFDYRNADGKYCGAFTEALIAVLKEVGGADISWAAICDAVRARVLRRFPTQRPDVEGPGQRQLFSLAEDNDRGIVTIRTVGDKLELPGGRLTGVVLGDVYGVMPVGAASYVPATAIAEVEVTELLALTAQIGVRAWKNGHTTIPVDAVAIPIVRNATKRAVALDVPGAARPAIEKAITEARTLRIANPGEPALATLRLTGDQLTIEDPAGPLFPPAPFPADLEPTIKNVANLGVAQAIRELEGEHGVFRNELEIELGTVEAGAMRPLHDHRAALGLCDRFYIQVKNRGDRQLFVHVFNVGVRGKVTLLTKNAAPSGVALQSGDRPFVLGKLPDGELRGVSIYWPKGLPQAGFPRVDEYFVFVTSSKVNLASLETQFHLTGTTERGSGTKLQDLLAQVHDGLTRDAGGDEPMEGFFVQRLSYLLYPRDAAMGGLAFQIDENPSGQAAAREADAWLARGIDVATKPPAPTPTDAPSAIAIRLADLVVNKNRAVFSADVRVDALICTRAADGQPGHATWTQPYSDIKDGERLPLDNGLLYLGPVHDFVDITLFVSRDTAGSLSLAKLFAERANSPEFQSAAGALLITAGAVAAPWVTAVGASAVLARMAYELVLRVAGTSIGLYRTSFLRRERFGVGQHPTEGLYRAQDFSFSLLIEPVEM